ncbi:MAG: DinB family protein [Pyrinomonadaceae bacterium]
MTLRDFFLQRRKVEAPVFLNVLKALPKDQLQYKPHEKSPTAEQLVWIITSELKACLDIVKEGKTEWNSAPPPPLDEMLEKYESWSNELSEQVSKMDDSAWDGTSGFYMDGKLLIEKPAGTFLLYILFDAIHHRGQLTAYLRPMGGKVPSVYGPSADDKSMGVPMA